MYAWNVWSLNDVICGRNVFFKSTLHSCLYQKVQVHVLYCNIVSQRCCRIKYSNGPYVSGIDMLTTRGKTIWLKSIVSNVWYLSVCCSNNNSVSYREEQMPISRTDEISKVVFLQIKIDMLPKPQVSKLRLKCLVLNLKDYLLYEKYGFFFMLVLFCEVSLVSETWDGFE